MNQNKIIGTAAVLGALSVAIGAFGAHGLEGLVEAGKLTDHICLVGCRFRLSHAKRKNGKICNNPILNRHHHI